MIILITGTPGSGKTLYAVSKILEYVQLGREVYAQIDGLNIQGVQEAPLDWRDTPDGSVIVYDEAQQHDNFKKGNATLSNDPIIQTLEVHRHTGHDIIFITQSPKFLHSHIVELVGEHYHLHRPYGAKLATVFLWRMCQKNPNTKSAKDQAENKFTFQYDKKLFNLYMSASQHTHKFTIPRKVIYFIILFIVLIGFVVNRFYHSKMLMGVAGIKTDSTAEVKTVNPSPQTSVSNPFPQSTTTEVKDTQRDWYRHDIPPVSSCVVSYPMDAEGCICKSFDDRVLNLSTFECYQVATHPTLWPSAPKRLEEPHNQLEAQPLQQTSDIKIGGLS